MYILKKHFSFTERCKNWKFLAIVVEDTIKYLD